MFLVFYLIIAASLFTSGGQCTKDVSVKGSFSSHDITIQKGSTDTIYLEFDSNATVPEGSDALVLLHYNFTVKNVVEDIPDTLINLATNQSVLITLKSKTAGHTVLCVQATPSNMTDLTEAYVRVSVSHSDSLHYFSEVVGWLYFIAWSVSFYPQAYLNFRRKSVIGLHFDFLALNVLGFFLYSIFNVGLYWIPGIEKQYFSRHPFGVNPVQLNDVIFAIHAFFACLVQVVQCIIYDRGDQKVSQTAQVTLGGLCFCTMISIVIAASGVIYWLDFLYIISYEKLFITLIKYIPQAYYNYRRKSTSGWSIGNVLLDFTGGSLSIAQMFIIAYNYNDWGSIFGDPTKFGLGLFSMIFDVLFMVQHYVLYKGGVSNPPQIRSPDQSMRDSLVASASESGNSNYGAISPA